MILVDKRQTLLNDLPATSEYNGMRQNLHEQLKCDTMNLELAQAKLLAYCEDVVKKTTFCGSFTLTQLDHTCLLVLVLHFWVLTRITEYEGTIQGTLLSVSFNVLYCIEVVIRVC